MCSLWHHLVTASIVWSVKKQNYPSVNDWDQMLNINILVKLSFCISVCITVNHYSSTKLCLFNSSSAVRFNTALIQKDLNGTAVLYTVGLNLLCVQSSQHPNKGKTVYVNNYFLNKVSLAQHRASIFISLLVCCIQPVQ